MTSDQVRNALTVDLKRRLAVLTEGTTAWRAAVSNHAAGLAIHTSQVAAVSQLVERLTASHATALDGVRATGSLTEFSNAYWALLQDFSTSQDVWRIFESILGQRQDPRLKLHADVADLIAWNCYKVCTDQARRWGIISDDTLREPPLTYLESSVSPSTASRGEQVQTLGLSMRQYRDVVLPVPIVLYPLDQASSMWMMCALAHEVGHNIDSDLDLREGRRVTDEFRQLLIGRVPNDREPHWRRWLQEMFADAIGTVLCGAGYAISTALWAIPLGASSAFQQLDRRAVHPPPYLRLRLGAQMLIDTGIAELRPHADALIDLWQRSSRPPWQQSFDGDIETISRLLMTEKVTTAQRTLLEIRGAAGMKFDHSRTEQLATHWLDPGKPQPSPNAAEPFPYRLIANAAAQAFWATPNADDSALGALQQNAIAYFESITAPAILASSSQKRSRFLTGLADRVLVQRRITTRQEDE